MTLLCSQMVDEVQAITGRVDDAVLIDPTRVTWWLNDGQKAIVDECPGLLCNYAKNVISVDTTQKLTYALTDWTFGDVTTQGIAHILGLWYLDGNESVKLKFTHIDEWDAEYPDPTHTDYDFNKPERWTRRGNNIEVFPLCATAYCDKGLRIDGNFYPADFSTDGTYSDLSNADEGLIRYGVAQAWRAIGEEPKAELWEGKFLSWLEDYKNKNNRLQEWPGNLYDDAIE